MTNPQENLTNNGKPHICGKLAIFNCTKKDSLTICTKCNLPIDSIENWEIEFYKEFLSKEYDISDYSYDMHMKQVKSFISSLLKKQKEGVIREIKVLSVAQENEFKKDSKFVNATLRTAIEIYAKDNNIIL